MDCQTLQGWNDCVYFALSCQCEEMRRLPYKGARGLPHQARSSQWLLVRHLVLSPRSWALAHSYPRQSSPPQKWWDQNTQHWGWAFFFFFKIYLFIICKYTVAVFRHSRRGRQILLRMVVSHHVVAGIWTPDLRKSSRVLLPTEPSHQPRNFIFKK
jgi:hypothetical protein